MDHETVRAGHLENPIQTRIRSSRLAASTHGSLKEKAISGSGTP
jgi:hypothetical protein